MKRWRFLKRRLRKQRKNCRDELGARLGIHKFYPNVWRLLWSEYNSETSQCESGLALFLLGCIQC
jgi:hypothetical protein